MGSSIEVCEMEHSHSTIQGQMLRALQRQCQPCHFKPAIRDAREEACSILAKHESAIMLPTQGDTKSTHQVCLWLGERDFQILADPSAATVLQAWAVSLEMDKEELEVRHV